MGSRRDARRLRRELGSRQAVPRIPSTRTAAIMHTSSSRTRHKENGKKNSTGETSPKGDKRSLVAYVALDPEPNSKTVNLGRTCMPRSFHPFSITFFLSVFLAPHVYSATISHCTVVDVYSFKRTPKLIGPSILSQKSCEQETFAYGSSDSNSRCACG